MKTYTRPPLPFQGNKYRWYRPIIDLAKRLPRGATVVDVFGGSGFLSHVIKQARPDCRVIWNDYDDYMWRLHHIPETNVQIQEGLRILSGYPTLTRVVGEFGRELRDYFSAIDSQGRQDWLTISSRFAYPLDYWHTWDGGEGKLLYSHDTSDNSFIPYSAAGYLAGVVRVREDWHTLCARVPANAVLILDPPYPDTDTGGYLSGAAKNENIELLHMCGERPKAFFSTRKFANAVLDKAFFRRPVVLKRSTHSVAKNKWDEILIIDL